MVVSTDTELSWLSLFSNLSSPSHQLVGVPVFEDGGSCGLYGGGSPVRERWKTSNIDTKTTQTLFLFQVLDHAQMSVMGDVTRMLQSNKGIRCPVL